MEPGQVIGSYVLEAKIADGGMGSVWRARNRVNNELRALKLIKPDLASNKEFVDRFVREATIAAQLRHPNLVVTHEPQIDGSTLLLPMEFLEGPTLSARIKVGPLSLEDVVAIIDGVCAGMQVVHDRQLLHRDLKPLNILLARVGDREVPKVLDFGTARQLDDDEHTRTGMVVGSPHYMAPEQARGVRTLTAAVDQYALGVIAYQMLTGARPYESDDTGSALAKLMQGLSYPKPSTLRSGLPESIEAAILRALHPDPGRRFGSVTEFAAALRQPGPAKPELEATLIRAESVEALPTPAGQFVPPPAAPVRAATGSRSALLGGAAVAVLLLTAGGGMWLFGRTAPEEVVVPAASAPTPIPAEPVTVPATVVVDASVMPSTAVPAPEVLVPVPEVRAPEPAHVMTPEAPVSAEPRRVPPTRRPRRPEPRDEPPCGPEYGIPCL